MSKSANVFWAVIAVLVVLDIGYYRQDHSKTRAKVQSAASRESSVGAKADLAHYAAHPIAPQPTNEAWLRVQNAPGAPAPLNTYTAAQLKVIYALYNGRMDGVKRFQDHCGKADVSYVRSTGRWAGATTLMYRTGQNPGSDDVSVIIGRRDALPQWEGDIYTEGGRDASRYAIKVYLATSGISKVALDAGRAVVLLGCHA